MTSYSSRHYPSLKIILKIFYALIYGAGSKGRDDCWREVDQVICVKESCERRISELQARYRLVLPDGAYFYQCGESPANELVVPYFASLLPTLIAERGDSVSLMFQQDSGYYAGGNETLNFQGDTVEMVWGFGETPVTCTIRPG